MSNITQEAEEKSVSRKRDKSTKREVSRMANKSQYETRTANALLYTLKRTGLPRLKVAKSVGLPGLIKFVVNAFKNAYTRGIALPVVHMKNEQDRDERGQRLSISPEIITAAYKAGVVILGGKHMYDRRLMPLLARTFPKAVDGAAYIRGLGAPTIGNGTFTNLKFQFRDITSVNAEGDIIHAGCDGSSRAHSSHPIWERILSDGRSPAQHRKWQPIQGLIIKGIIVPDDRCVDEHGQPALWIDWLCVKGRFKDLAKSKSGLNSGAFSSEGVLIRPDLLQKVDAGEGYFTGILQKWDRLGYIRWCFEILERIQDNSANRERVVMFLKQALAKLTADGGIYGILDKKCKDDPKLEFAVQLCAKLSESSGHFVCPLQIPFVKDFVDDELQRKMYHLRQGAGKRSLRYVAVIDNGVPPGHAVIGHLHHDGEWRFNHGDDIAVTRFPMILPQALKVLKVIDPRKRQWSNLSHLLVKTSAGEQVPNWVIYFNSHDIVDGMQGDDDGDTVLVDYCKEVVAMFRDRIGLIPGTEDDTFLIEPGKVNNSWKSSVELCTALDTVDPSIVSRIEESKKFKVYGTEYAISKKALQILGTDGRGPVGQLTYYCSMFLALGMRRHALACSVLIQEAIDAAKHIVHNSDPTKLVNPMNWKNENGKISPVNCRSEDGEWDDENGHLNMETFAAWVSRETGGAKMSEVLTWKTEGKKVRDGDVAVQESERGENLVHFCAKTFEKLWTVWKEENIKPSPRVDLASILPTALGIQCAGYHPDSSAYKALLNKSGLPKFGSNVKSIRNEGLEPEQRNAKIEAEQAILVETLRSFDMLDLLSIWVTELKVADHKRREKQDCKTNVNRAFRAVAFEGSPILDAIGIEMTFPCTYLAGAGSDVFFGKLKKAVEDGEEQDIFHAAAHWSDRAEDHMELTGKPASDCKHCKDLIQAKVVSHVRTSREGKGYEFTKRVAHMCKTMNGIMQNK